MTRRHTDSGASLRAFEHEVLAECPSCGGCVRVVPHGEPREYRRAAACARCGWSRVVAVTRSVWGGPVDPYFELPLWLRTRVGGEELWAFNAEHLDVLESYVVARLRERPAARADASSTAYAGSMLERLPPWLKSAKNREDVLAGVARLRERLARA